MNQTLTQPRFPLLRSVILMLLASAALVGGLWFLLPALFEDAQVHVVLMIAAGIVTGSAVLALVPVGLIGHLGVMPTVYAFFFGAAVRILVAILATVMAVVVWEFSPGAWATALFGLYLPLLFLESGLVGWYLWHMNGNAVAQGRATAGDATIQTDPPHVRMEALA